MRLPCHHVEFPLDAHRVAAVKGGSTTLASYDYLGMSRVVRVNDEQPRVRLDLWGGTSGAYAGLDRLGRVTDQRWIDYGYDRASNRTYSENTQTAGADELYAYDGLNRLTQADRGDLNAVEKRGRE